MTLRTFEGLALGLVLLVFLAMALWFATREWRADRRSARRFDRHRAKRKRDAAK